MTAALPESVQRITSQWDSKELAAAAVPSNPPSKIKFSEGPQFTRYVLPYGSQLPPGLDFSGSISVNHDKGRVGWLHVLVYLAQKIHAWLFGRTIDPDFVHGHIIIGHDQRKPNHLLIAHSLFSGIKSTSHDYLHDRDRDITSMYIYVPKDPNLRQLLSKHAQQTVYIPEKFLPRDPSGEPPKPRLRPGFSIGDMLQSILHNRALTKKSKRGAKEIERNAYVVADLLLGKQLFNKRKLPRAHFCTAYAFTILQGSLLINALSEAEIKAIKTGERGPRSRDQIAAIITRRLRAQDPEDMLSTTFWKNPCCQQNARFLLSGYAQQTLESVATPA